MTDRSGATSQGFAFQTSDQAGASQHLQQSYGHYDAERDTSAPGASKNQAQTQDPSLQYPDFGAHPQHVAPGPFGSFGFGPSAPLGWDWTNSVDFSEFTNQYEPQGELAQELQNQIASSNDFSIPLPIIAPEPNYQQIQQTQSANAEPIGAHNPLSPPPRPPQQRPIIQTGMKRKADSEPGSAVSQNASIATENPTKRQNKSRQSSDASLTSPVITQANTRPPSTTPTAAATAATEPASQAASQGNTEAARRKEQQSKGTGPQGRVIDVSKPRKVAETPGGPGMLPAGKVFPIQIGSELFRLSGASISSDAPSYFSHFFIDQLHNNGGRAGDVRTLYIDRDPDTFRDIALHLQGYHVIPKDGAHFVKLFADAQFYSLPRFTKQLFNTDIFIRIGGTPFQIPRDLFSAPGDSPNYFSLGFAQFFSTPAEVFPGLDRSALLRPPSILPPSVPNKNGETFAELIQILQGYNVEIRNDDHRSRLLKDARYFHLKGLEQRLIPCEISYNLKRQQSEILLRLEDIRQSGISFSPDKPSSDSESGTVSGAQSMGVSPGPLPSSKTASPARSLSSSSSASKAGYVSYARPYTDDHARTNILILEVSTSESTTLYLPLSAPKAMSPGSLEVNLRSTFHNSTLARITSFFSVIASKMGLPATQPLGLMYLQSGGGVAAQPVSPANSGVSERRVRVRLDGDCSLEINGSPAEVAIDTESGRVGIRRSRDVYRSTQQHSPSQIESEWFWGGNRVDPGQSLSLGADDEEPEMEWTVKRAHWRIRVEPVESDGEARRMQVVLCGVKIEAFTIERTRNLERGFLGSG
ncbi:BTB/POZ domain-containing protein [Cucurbitaria berberidis CBS 394.84]|uniref:BTB/POZ domain-containing protein n=1 Tax=Cucurbitaria berberidis CBS 394.84 TaxID=1168544 RepID=A0A9P4GF81_9PLEO|nr:BTB/POZ domain-containing protein [Cucurbitaria berberidis CBS 394.84]KAF1844272.1 BTB/POZ domain-containing protein [Cucurbitaria berberidis CBS 394.84]